MKATIAFRWYDLWVGFFWDNRKRRLYFCPLPTLVICLEFARRNKEQS